jgi:hypothetical protein
MTSQLMSIFPSYQGPIDSREASHSRANSMPRRPSASNSRSNHEYELFEHILYEEESDTLDFKRDQ